MGCSSGSKRKVVVAPGLALPGWCRNIRHISEIETISGDLDGVPGCPLWRIEIDEVLEGIRGCGGCGGKVAVEGVDEIHEAIALRSRLADADGARLDSEAAEQGPELAGAERPAPVPLRPRTTFEIRERRYDELGPFEFDRRQYEQALEALLRAG